MLQTAVAWAKLVSGFVIAWFAFTLIGVLVMVQTTPPGASPSPGWTLVIICGPAGLAYFAGRWLSAADFRRLRDASEAKVREARLRAQATRDAGRWQERQFLHRQVDQHRAALQRNVRNALVKNDYGLVTTDRRRDAVLEFLRSIDFAGQWLEIDDAIAEVLADLAGNRNEQQQSGFDPERVPVNGHEFEHWVAASLQQFGWQAEVTRAAGDQGIDVIAEKHGLSVGIQCKLYSQPVGNAAIQQALAGARYHGCHRAAVLSNATFTRSATELAHAADVALLSPFDIPSLDRRYFLPARA